MQHYFPAAWQLAPLLIATCLTPTLAQADSSTLSITFENDGLASSDDGHFTSGFDLGWAFEPGADSWTQRLATALPDALIGSADTATYRLTHQIYTPDNIETRELIEDDRPYAGLIYGGLSLYEERPLGGWRQATGLHLDLGLIGPSSQADSIQDKVHRVTNNDRPKGWHHQLGDEPLLNLTVQRSWWDTAPLMHKQLAHGPHLSAALGNLHTYASTGYSVRWGDDATGIPTLTPSPDSRSSMRRTNGWQWYLFARLDGYYKAHDLTLDGNTFRSSHSVTRKEWVGDVSAGFALAWEDWQVTYTATLRSREFEGQKEQDRFGGLTFSKRL